MRLHRSTFGELSVVVALACSLACARFAGNSRLAFELAAIQSMRAIFAAEVQYYAQYGKYADTLAVLGSAALIPSTVASGEKDGYVFTLALKPGGFAIQAAPKVFGQTGGRTFFCNQDGVIRQNVGPEAATESSPEVI